MRIGIVNDTTIAVEALRRALLRSREHEVAWVAHDGFEAVSRCAKDLPDLVLMDLVMPGMDGVEATRQIMARHPCPIVVATASVDRNSSKVFAAMGAGALDAVRIPSLQPVGASDDSGKFLGRIHTINRLIHRGRRSAIPAARLPSDAPLPGKPPLLIAIGASAGGPSALADVLSKLPPSFDAAVVVVQHVDARFSDVLATTMARQVRLPVHIARAGDHPVPGSILLADSRQRHLVVREKCQLGYSAIPDSTSYRPSIDVFFQSIKRHWHGEVIGVLLTGMGRDGAAGLKALRNAGHRTIVQDQASSAVFGMPKAAMELDAATEVLGLEEIGPRLVELAKRMATR